MGVTIRQRKGWPGWWVYLHHEGKRESKYCKTQEAAEEVAKMWRGGLAKKEKEAERKKVEEKMQRILGKKKK